MDRMIRAVGCVILLGWVIAFVPCEAQSMPTTEGETLAGQHSVLAEAVRGHAVLVIASFSKDAGKLADEWTKAVKGDASLASVTVFQAAMLQQAPGFIRGMIKAGMRKDVPAADLGRFFVFTADESLWRTYFGVTTDKDPYIVLIDAAGQVRWHGHGAATNLEPLIKDALR
ncbi:MAG: hypothetical protein ABR987_02440 [Terracidiphilus sp.]